MCRQADAANIPSVAAISLVFGGGMGTLLAAAFGLNAGAGLVAGACLVFLLLWASALRPREHAQKVQGSQPGDADEGRAAALSNRVDIVKAAGARTTPDRRASPIA